MYTLFTVYNVHAVSRCIMYTLFTVYNVHAVPEEFSISLEDTHASKVPFSLIKHIFFETLTSSRNIRYIITKIYVIVGTIVSN